MSTQHGLNRFDGSKFSVYNSQNNNKSTLVDNLIRTSYMDKKGNLWFGTMGDGISKYNESSDDFSNFVLESEVKAGNSEFSTSITEDHNGIILVGTRNNGIWAMRNLNEGFRKVVFTDSNTGLNIECITSLFFDSENKMWIGTWTSGVYIFEETGKMIFSSGSGNRGTELIADHVRCFFEGNNKEIWIGTNKGLCRVDSCLNNWQSIPLDSFNYNKEHKVTSITYGNNSDLWIGSLNSGLFHLEEDGSIVNFKMDLNNKNTLSDNSILSLCRDSSNVLWIGTIAGGVNKTDLEQKPFKSLYRYIDGSKEEIIQNVHAVCEDNEHKIWIGTSKNGPLVFINNKDIDQTFHSTIAPYEDLKTGMVLSIIEDKNGNVWICTFNETVYKFNKSDGKLEKFILEGSGGIHCMCNYDGHIIAGTDRGGIKAINIEHSELRAFKYGSQLNGFLMDKTIFVILVDKDKQMWIGTKNDGLFRFDIDGNVLFSYKNMNNNYMSLRDNCIISLFESSDGNIWVGTKSGGLHYYDKTVDNLFPIETGTLDKESIRGFSEDHKGRLWISTNNGIICYDQKSHAYQVYDVSDGELSNEYNELAFYTSAEGVVYFGGVDGVTYFKPEEIKDNPYIPNIVLTDFEIFNKPVLPSADNPYLKKNISYADEINLTYKESVFSFGFAALIFNNPQKNQYAYKMEGFDKDWTYCGKRKRVTYTNLDPGQYIFRVKGSNNDGIWNEEGTSIRINISPPYWQTWWFRTLGALAAIAATGLTYKQRLEKMEKEKQSQEEFSRRLIESQEDERKRVSSELHHTVAHDVLIAKNKAQMALKHKDDAGKMEQALREITDLAASTMKDVRNISYNLHPHQLEQLGFTKALKSIITEVSKSTEINFKFEIDDVDKLLTKEYEINLFRAIQESVTNVLKHSEAKDSLLKVSRSRGFVFIVLSDNGKGFDTKNFKLTDKKSGLGIKNISERIKLMKGEYKIESQPGKGTTVVYKIPI
jgi:signal transduction histidine kinase